MILVTVGTHEQGFDRLVRAAEALARATGERVVVQAGAPTDLAPSCEVHELLTPDRMEALAGEARIVVTHAGPCSILLAAAAGHVPIVVPRDPAHGEHVDRHQLRFAERLRHRVHVLVDPAGLTEAVARHGEVTPGLEPLNLDVDRATSFAAALGALVEDVVSHRSRRRSLLRATLGTLGRRGGGRGRR